MIAAAGSAQTRKRSPVREQVNFSAEDERVKNPVPIPAAVLDILREDKLVRGALEDQNISPERLPTSWFSASAIRLGTQGKRDLIVVGEPPVSGGNIAQFWVFRATPKAYELVLQAGAHDLAVKNTRANGYRDLELVSMSAVQISRTWCRFDGRKYKEYRSKTQDID